MDSSEGRPSEVAPPRHPWWALFVLAGVALVGVATFLIVGGPARIATALPSFASLRSHPDANIVGTVAYERVGVVEGKVKRDCFDVIAAGGGPPRQLFCVAWRRTPVKEAAIVWLSDGNLEVTSRDANKWRKVVDSVTGAVRDVAWGPPVASTSAVGPQGQVVESRVFLGTLSLSLSTGSTSRTLLSVGVPVEYSFSDPAWSVTGKWFVLADSAGRLLVVTTGTAPSVRYLTDGLVPAVTDTVFAPTGAA